MWIGFVIVISLIMDIKFHNLTNEKAMFYFFLTAMLTSLEHRHMRGMPPDTVSALTYLMTRIMVVVLIARQLYFIFR
jgi:hypothetical protein